MEVKDYAKERAVERLLGDIRWKVDQLMADDDEAYNAGVTDGPLPSLGDDEWLEEEETTGKESWKHVKLVAQLEREQVLLQRRRRYFQTLLTHSVFNEWIRANTAIKDGVEIQRIRETVQAFLREDRIQELKLYLTDVLQSGKEAADKTQKRRLRGGWAWLGYSFTIIRGIVYVGAVLAVLSVAESHFQKVSLAVLVMIGNMLLTNRGSDGLYRMRYGAVTRCPVRSVAQVLQVSRR